ncbi:MAG: phosphoenolpyruvate carboxykinase [bacterium]|nr:phosphoenolpyruvate carboxykinase [bacterium]
MALDFKLTEFDSDKIINRNLSAANLVESALKNDEGILSNKGAFVVNTGKYTGRSPGDKFIVSDQNTEGNIWWGKVNQAINVEDAAKLRRGIINYLKTRQLFVQDSFAGADKKNRLPVRVIAERAWHALFAKNMFIEPSLQEIAEFSPSFTVLHAPGFKADPKTDGTRSEAAVVVDFTNREVLICGTEYAGEIKKSIFSIMNYLLPEKNILGMHCSANIGKQHDVAVFFGLSGTGKTTLSADPERQLIGDDEHGWSDDGIFNFEGGCYAKVIRLGPKEEPEIFKTTQTFGTILENVVIDKVTRELDLNSDRLTENTRASYPIEQIANAYLPGVGANPKHIVMLTCDAFGVLPPLSRLTPAQAMYHFISGYTAKVAGTERGVTEPTAVFSACFGAPFMPRHPQVYAKLLGDKIAALNVDCWLVNTGWLGGPYGIGNRMKIGWTRALLNAALSGALNEAEFFSHRWFKIDVPLAVPGVPSEVLDPRKAWDDAAAYDAQAKKLVHLFHENFKTFESTANADIINAAPNF